MFVPSHRSSAAKFNSGTSAHYCNLSFRSILSEPTYACPTIPPTPSSSLPVSTQAPALKVSRLVGFKLIRSQFCGGTLRICNSTSRICFHLLKFVAELQSLVLPITQFGCPILLFFAATPVAFPAATDRADVFPSYFHTAADHFVWRRGDEGSCRSGAGGFYACSTCGSGDA
jgi:hypothetical protein